MVLESEVTIVPKREYHNLRGLVRDIERALREGDYSEVAAFVDLVDDFADARVLETDDASREGRDAGLDLPDQQSLPRVGGSAPGHDSGSTEALGELARLRDQVERLVALSTSAGRVPGDVADVAAATRARVALGGVRGTRTPN